jgi:hypothetical protein
MFSLVNRRLRLIAHVLVFAQLLLSAPVVGAMAGAGAASHASGCAGHVPSTDPHGSCPCCPDGVTTGAGCLAACMAGVASLHSYPPVIVEAVRVAPDAVSVPVFDAFDDAPLKPPPIR